MRFLKFGYIIKALCLILTLLLLSSLLIACSDKVKDPILLHGEVGISLEIYEFMLSRMKGALARNQYDVGATSDFWTEEREVDGLTNEEHYNKAVLENCKKYLAALAMFEEEGMALSDAELEAIDEEISFYVDYDGKGSEEKLDLILSKYCTDTEGLRKIYELEAKYNAVMEMLYGKDGAQIGGTVKDEYYKQNYYRFKQILISNFYYEYIVDANGDMIYFDSESGKPLYDSNGSYDHDENGDRLLDSYGVAIRFDNEGNILYDKVNGRPAPTTDEDLKAIEHKYSEEEMAERVESIDAILSVAEGGNFSAFEAEMPKWQVYAGAGEAFPDGYYLSDIESGMYDSSMLDILSELKEMEIGEVRVVESESGYHIIMKYELDAGKYSDSGYSSFFSEFDKSLTDKLFLDRCKKYYDGMVLDEDILGKAKSIKSVGTNYDY